jgi:hypothetical protein
VALVILTWDGRAIRFTDERWDHVVQRHALLHGQRDRLIETGRFPDLVRRGDGGEVLAIRRYVQPPFDGRHLVLAYVY